MTVEAKLNHGTQRRTLRKSRIADDPKKKRLEKPKLEIERRYDPTLVYPPKEEKEIVILADELKAWALTTQALRIERFALGKGMNPYHFKQLRTKNEYFAEIYQMVESIFACKYSEGSLTREFDAGTAHRHLWMVDQEYYNRSTQLDREKLEQAKKETEKNTVFSIHMENYETTTEKPTE